MQENPVDRALHELEQEQVVPRKPIDNELREVLAPDDETPRKLPGFRQYTKLPPMPLDGKPRADGELRAQYRDIGFPLCIATTIQAHDGCPGCLMLVWSPVAGGYEIQCNNCLKRLGVATIHEGPRQECK